MSNSVNLALDVTKTGIQNTLIKVRQGDGGFETLHTTVTSNGEPMDLQGWTITFMGTTAGNHKIIDANVKIVEAPNGIFEYTPSKAWGMDIGYFKIAYFKFVKGDGSASSANFRVNVIEAVDLSQEEAQNYISVVDATISEIDKQLNDSLANVTQSIAETSSAASSLAVNVSSVASGAVDEINDTASSTAYNVNSVASNAVNNVNSTASSAVDNVNNTASNAVNNVNVTASNATSSVSSVATSLGQRVDEYNQKLARVEVGVRNLYINTTQVPGFVSATGTIASPNIINKEMASDYIPVLPNTQYIFQAWGSLLSGQQYWAGIGQYDANKVFLNRKFGLYSVPTATSDVANDYEKLVFTTDANTYFVRVSSRTFGNYKVKFERGTITTDWTPAPEDAPSNDAQLVHKTGTETIAGDKTFTGNTTLSTTTILAGSYGLRVTASGVQKTTDGKTWVSANI